MKKQFTIKNEFELWGVEPYGGNNVKVRFSGSEPNEGITFVTKKGSIKAKLHYASQYKSSVLLKNRKVGILHVEHLLASLNAYGVDNATIYVEREPSASFLLLDKWGLATEFEVVPNFEDGTYGLCEKLDNNLVEQDSPRRLLTLDRKIGDLKRDKLTFEPCQEEGLIIQATTAYPFLGEQKLSIKVDSETYKREIAKARPYSKHYFKMPDKLAEFIVSIANPSFGIGHGFDPETNILLPIFSEKDMYKVKTIYSKGDEPVRHTILDRMGEIKLLPGELHGVKVTAKFGGHHNNIKILNRLLNFLDFS